ncbi:MAG: hypothetical protein OXL41_00010 [Nitrospinae bacterium]|nr:hypothetical protein [Nitrospinota bacterium]
MTAIIRSVIGVILAATLSLAASAAADEGARLFAAHTLALRAEGVAGGKQAAEVLAGMPGAGMIRETSPAALWSPFFSNAVVKLGRLRSPAPSALYYDPLLDVALLTIWEKKGNNYQVSTIRALPGERLNNPDTKLSLKPPWMSASGGLVDTLASTTKKRLNAFSSAHPAASLEGAHDAVTFASAAADMRAVLPRLAWIALQRARWAEKAGQWLGRTLEVVEKALAARNSAAIKAAAPDTDAETAAMLADLPAAFAAKLALDMILETGAGDRLLIGSLPEDGDIYVLAHCLLKGDICGLRRFILISLLE